MKESHPDAEFRSNHNSFEVFQMKSIKNKNYMYIKWLIDETVKMENNISSDGLNLLSYILGHEGKNSIHSFLLDKGYIYSLYAGKESTYGDKSVYTIGISLTDKGLESYNDIIYFVVSYINRIKIELDDGNLMEEFYNEILKINKIYVQDTNPSSGNMIANKIVMYNHTYKLDPRYILVKQILTDEFDSVRQRMIKYIETMTLDNCKVLLTSNKIKDTDKIDTYYGTEYKIESNSIDNNLLKKALKTLKSISLPNLNKYLPTDLKIIDPDKNNSDSLAKIDSPNIWFLKNKNEHHEYTFNLICEISLSNLTKKDIKNYISLLIYLEYLEILHKETNYDFRIANYDIQINLSGSNTISIDLSGYSEHAEDILNKVLSNMFDKNQRLDKHVYEVVFNDIQSSYQNEKFSEPFNRLTDIFISKVNPDCTYSIDEIEENLDLFSFKKLNENFIKDTISLLTKGHIRGVIGGSIEKNRAHKMIKIIESKIKFDIEHTNCRINPSIFQTYSNDIIKINTNPIDNNTAILYGVYLDNIKEYKSDNWADKYLLGNLLKDVSSEKFFNKMRTEKELGYVVISNIFNVNTTFNRDIFLGFIIQRNNHGDEFSLSKLINEFINTTLYTTIKNISDSKWDSIKNGLKSKIKMKFISTYDEISYYLSVLEVKSFKNLLESEVRFDRREILLESLDNLTKDDLLEYFKDRISKNRIISLIIKPHKI